MIDRASWYGHRQRIGFPLPAFVMFPSFMDFLHKVKNGAVDKSYGIHVARLAKMPDSLLKRADEILNEYESNAKKKNPEEKIQLTMDFVTNVKKDDIIKETIENIDVLNTTPMEALNVLFDLKQKIKKGE